MAPEDFASPRRPSLNGPIREINANLESLRDFVDVLNAYLTEKSIESFNRHESALIPLLIALQDAGVLEGNDKLELIPPERLEELKRRFPVAKESVVAPREDGEGWSITLGLETKHDAIAAVREVSRAHSRTRMLYSSSLMNLTSSVELFFAGMLHVYFGLHPEAIGAKEKVFSLEDLSGFDSIADARAHYVLSRIEELLRGSLGDWLSYARSTLKLSMGYLKDDLALLEETFQRRNIIVHNGGRANSIYLSKVPPALRGDIKIGQELAPDREYLHTRIDLWEKSCILIGAELWKQLMPGDATRAETMADIAYKHLLAGRWSVAEAISMFILRDKLMPESSLAAAQLNYWQCRKRVGAWTEVAEEVSNADFSAKSARYQLARFALMEVRDEFFELLPRAIKAGDISVEELKEFPIFEAMRSDERYAKHARLRKPRATRRRDGQDTNDLNGPQSGDAVL